MPYSMRKRIKAVSDSSDNYSDSDEDYVPIGNEVSFTKLTKIINKNSRIAEQNNSTIEELINNLNKNKFWSNLMWFIKWFVIIITQMYIAIYCIDYLYNIIKPDCINFSMIAVILAGITSISMLQVSIQHYYKKMIE